MWYGSIDSREEAILSRLLLYSFCPENLQKSQSIEISMEISVGLCYNASMTDRQFNAIITLGMVMLLFCAVTFCTFVMEVPVGR